MPGLTELTSVWKNIKEFELAPIRDEALHQVSIAVVGVAGEGREALVEQMRRDPSRNLAVEDSLIQPEAPLQILSPQEASRMKETELIILVVSGDTPDLSLEQSLSRAWGNQGLKVLVFCQASDPAHAQATLHLWAPWNAAALLYGSAADTSLLTSRFVPAVLRLLPGRYLALGRQFPLFRSPIAHQLIQDTCYANAAYALGTGVAEIVPLLNIPLSITDLVVLTKAQAFLAYRLGLLLGFSTAWQDYLAEFGGVIGSGFIWRQLARYLVGLIPFWGILPKVAIAYAGTYLVGSTVLQWYRTGRHLSPAQARDLYRRALLQGRQNARTMLARLPKPRLRLPRLHRPRLRGNRKKSIPPDELEIPLPDPIPQHCPNCDQQSAWDARFCQYCGYAFTLAEPD